MTSQRHIEPALLEPEQGGRVEVRLDSADDNGAIYLIAWLFPDAKWHGTARISSSGAVSLEGEPLLAWADTFTRASLRSLFRTQQIDGKWPRRITRWRAAQGSENPT